MKFRLIEDLDNISQKAKDYFGTTYYFSEAGFLLTDGSLLDFSGKKFGGKSNERSMDHREIASIYKNKFNTATEYLIDFMNHGNIRLIPEQGIDLIIEPTQKQYIILKKFINNYIIKNKEFILDISNSKGYPVENKYFEGTAATANNVINYIKDYFK